MTLSIGDNVVRNTTGLTPFNVSAQIRGWNDEIKDIGGYWQGGGQFWTGDNDNVVSRLEAVDFFLTRLGGHIVRSQAGKTCWEGRVTAMDLTLDGVTYRRALADLVNRLKIVYSRFTGDGIYDDGELSALSGGGGDPWNQTVGTYNAITSFKSIRQWYGGGGHPNYGYPTVTKSAAWSTRGTYSIKVDCSTCGGLGETFGGGIYVFSNITATPNGFYLVTADINVISNPDGLALTIAVQNQTGAALYQANVISGVGIAQIKSRFQASSSASGTLQIEILQQASVDNAATYYIDNVSLKEVGTRRETEWATDADSVAEYGTHEVEVTVGGMTEVEANARLAQIIANAGWPRTSIQSLSASGDGLKVEAEGYITTLAGQNVATTGDTKTCHQHIIDLVGLSEFVTVGYAGANTLLKYVDNLNPIRLWDAIQDCVDAGGVAGARYIGGCYAGRKFVYQSRPTTVAYKRKGGRWLYPDNSEADPQTMLPGIVYLEDMPSGGGLYPTIEDNPRYVYVSGWRYDADSNTAEPTETRKLLE